MLHFRIGQLKPHQGVTLNRRRKYLCIVRSLSLQFTTHRFEENTVDLITKSKEVLVYVHIPKTAGNAIDSFICGEFCESEMIRRIGPMTPDTVVETSPRLLAGHWYKSEFEQFCTANALSPVFLTCVRDPAERLLSNLHYAVFNLDKVYPKKYDISGADIKRKGFNWALRKSLSKEKMLEGVCKNIQWRMVVGPIAPLTDFKPNDEEAVAIAEERLREYAVVGLQNQLEESVLLMAYTLRLLVPERIPVQNRNSSKIVDDKYLVTDKELLDIHCHYDFILYRIAEKIFKEKYNEMLHQVLQEAGRNESSLTGLDRHQRYQLLRSLINASILQERLKNKSYKNGVIGRSGFFPGSIPNTGLARNLSPVTYRIELQNKQPVTELLYACSEIKATFFLMSPTADITHVGFPVIACLHRQVLFNLSVFCNDSPVQFFWGRENNGRLMLLVPIQPSTPQQISFLVGNVPHLIDIDASVPVIAKNSTGNIAIGLGDDLTYYTPQQIPELLDPSMLTLQCMDDFLPKDFMELAVMGTTELARNIICHATVFYRKDLFTLKMALNKTQVQLQDYDEFVSITMWFENNQVVQARTKFVPLPNNELTITAKISFYLSFIEEGRFPKLNFCTMKTASCTHPSAVKFIFSDPLSV